MSPSIRSLRAVLIVGAAIVAGTPSPSSAGDAPASPTACVVPVFLDDDATLRAAYDGLRAGLEEASLPRACLRTVATDTPEGWARELRAVQSEAPPFVVAMGRRASEVIRSVAAPSGKGVTPCIYVDVAFAAGLVVEPAAPSPPMPSAVVRAEIAFERVGRVVADLLPGRPTRTVRLPWASSSPAADAFIARAATAAGFAITVGPDGPADVVLSWTPGFGEVVRPFSQDVATARRLRAPLLAFDRAHFGEGAAVVIVPDAALLGRTAAEAARRLVNGDDVPEPLRVRTIEVWVDLEAASAQGLEPPIPFLARADRIRAKKPAATAGPK